MTSDNTSIEAKITQDGKIRFGETLKTTREGMGLSVQDAAARLNLSPRFIHILETEDLLQSSLPPIYLRGYLRSYSKILNIGEKELNAVLDKLNPTPAISLTEMIPADSLSPSFPLESKLYFPRLGTFFISLVLLSSVTAWWYLHGQSPTTTTIALTQPVMSNPGENAVRTFENKDATLAPKDMMIANDNAPHSNTAPASLTLPSKPQLALAPNAGKIAPKAPLGNEGSEEADEAGEEQD